MPSHVAKAVLTVLSALALASPTLARPEPCTPPDVRLNQGRYVGVHNQEYDQDFFLGIPYAQPPVGSLRFAAPQPLQGSSKQTFDATKYGWMCIGYGSDQSNLGNPVSEDCLTLNVVRPKGVKPGDDLPVGVWVHGGSYVQGGSRDPRYNLTYIVDQSVKENKPIVAVSINYRLSNWGFLFSEEMQQAGAGNVAFKDQRLALQWLKANIGAFGGSAQKVTIWGESAGARSLGMQLIAYDGKSDGLFRSAILQSGSPVAVFKNASDWQPYFDALVQKTGCADAADRLTCLRALPWKTLDAIFSGATALDVTAPTLSAVIDGDFMTAQGSVLLRQGKFAKVPLLTGNNFDEGTAYAGQGINTDDEFRAWLRRQGLNDVQIAAISLLYPDDPAVGIPASYQGRPPAPFGGQFKRSAAFAGDYQQHSGRRLLVESYAKTGQAVYSYLWNVIVAGLPNPVYGATHFQEVAFVFDNVRGEGYAVSPFEGMPESYVRLADLMSRMWVSFMHGGDPNVGEGLEWPVYTAGRSENLVFDTSVDGLRYVAEDEYRRSEIAYLLDSVFV